MKANIKMWEVWSGKERKMSHNLDRKWLIKTNVEMESNWKIGGEPVTLLNFFRWARAFLWRGWTSLGAERALRWARETLHTPTALSPSANWGFIISGALLSGGREGKMRERKWRLRQLSVVLYRHEADGLENQWGTSLRTTSGPAPCELCGCCGSQCPRCVAEARPLEEAFLSEQFGQIS